MKKNYRSRQCQSMRVPLFLPIIILSLILSNAFNGFAAPETEITEKTYGEEKQSAHRILVAYATRAGSTAEVADIIGKKLAISGVRVDVKPIKTVQCIDAYQGVILGSAIRRGAILPELTNFVKTYKDDLGKIPTAYFIVCMIVREDTEKNRKTAASYLDSLRAEVTPVDTGIFAGKLDYSKLDFIEAIIIKYIIGTPEGDLRDWQKINDWAENLGPRLLNINKEK